MNVVLAIGKGIQVDAQDAANFFDTLGKDIAGEAKQIASPKAMLALAILATAMVPAITDGMAAAAQDGLNITLDATTLQLLIKLWPDFTSYLNALAVRPVASKSTAALLKET
jgi:hypothetical protein